jgi:hypothetical protein
MELTMLKKLARTLGLTSLLLSATSQALPIVQADAFVAGDNKAALQTSTGLVWMDFGVNNHLLNIQVVDLLATDYAGWRLPTESEAMGWIDELVGHLPEWLPGYGSFKYLDPFGTNQFDYFNALLDVIGFDQTFMPTASPSGYPTRTLTGNFAMNTGETGVFNLGVTPDDESAYGYFYVESWAFPNYLPGTTLLVKDTSASVPEPSTLVLGLIALLALAYRRKLAR